jgi:hypothetical protein
MLPRKMMGFETPDDQRVMVPIRDLAGTRLALWRSKVAWDIAERVALEIIGRCKHTEGCPGATVETEPCLSTCVDRELRMDALVILNAARMFAPTDARQPATGPYLAPSREYFSAVVAELGAVQIENDALRAKLLALGGEEPTPNPNVEARKRTQLTSNFNFAELEAHEPEPEAP